MRIGIIGAENSHAKAIAKVINVDKLVNGCSVQYLWGETPAYAEETAREGAIPHIVDDPADMLGKIDALIVDHRHAKEHLPAARPFIERGVPTFIDKPFCYRAQEGKEFLKLAGRKGAAVTSFGIVPHQASFLRFMDELETLGTVRAGYTYGPCDLASKWGGVFFYGVHQVEVALEAFGYDVKSVLVTKNGSNASAQLMYPHGLIVTLALIKEGVTGFGIGAVCEKGPLHASLEFDENPFLTGVKLFTDMFQSGKEPYTYSQMLRPIQALEALERSASSGHAEKVV